MKFDFEVCVLRFLGLRCDDENLGFNKKSKIKIKNQKNQKKNQKIIIS
jgi:hypothetical protein